MCDVLDKIEERGIAIGESRMIVKMYQNGLSKEQIADVTDKKIQEIELLLKTTDFLKFS